MHSTYTKCLLFHGSDHISPQLRAGLSNLTHKTLMEVQVKVGVACCEMGVTFINSGVTCTEVGVSFIKVGVACTEVGVSCYKAGYFDFP